MRLSEIPAALGATVVRDAEFDNLGFLFDNLENKLVFCEAQRFVAAVRQAHGAGCVLCSPDLGPAFKDAGGLALADEPRIAFFRIQRFLVKETQFYGEPFATEIHSSAHIHPRAWVEQTNVRIGPDTVIEANAVIGRETIVGARAHIRAGAVIGSEGFQSARQRDEILQMEHGGGVVIQDAVEIFANAVVARAVFRQSTVIGEWSRIGNGAFVSHNVQIGKRCFVGHNAAINGNTTVGDDVWIGPNATVSNLLHIGDGAKVSLGATVVQSLPPGARVTGMTALEHQRMLRLIASSKR
ncbi:MAG: DapH/DapD/GlmU-related protein [Bryobacteraceae bacterium]